VEQVAPAPYAEFPAPSNGVLVVPVDLYPDLAREGGAITARVEGFSTPLLLMHPGGDVYACTSSTCTHVGCPVGFDGERVLCPCHGSEFSTQGQVLRPPAQAPLLSFASSFDAQSRRLVVQLALTQAVLPAPVAGNVRLALSDFPALGAQGGTVLGTPSGQVTPLLVIALGGGQFVALDPVCSHQACALVTYAPSDGHLHCPCHGSVFATTGAVVQGPAAKPLTSHLVSFDGSAVTVALG
jgi:Rieske Fe-S protein